MDERRLKLKDPMGDGKGEVPTTGSCPMTDPPGMDRPPLWDPTPEEALRQRSSAELNLLLAYVLGTSHRVHRC